MKKKVKVKKVTKLAGACTKNGVYTVLLYFDLLIKEQRASVNDVTRNESNNFSSPIYTVPSSKWAPQKEIWIYTTFKSRAPIPPKSNVTYVNLFIWFVPLFHVTFFIWHAGKKGSGARTDYPSHHCRVRCELGRVDYLLKVVNKLILYWRVHFYIQLKSWHM